MVILSVDVGKKRVGLAVTDELCITAQPLSVLEAESAVNDIKKICEQRKIERIIIGLPLDAQGYEGHSARMARDFGSRLEKAVAKAGLNPEVEYWDEGFSTEEAEGWLREAGLKGKKRRRHVDKMAAVAILESYLRERGCDAAKKGR